MENINTKTENLVKINLEKEADGPCREAKILKNGFIKAVCEMSKGNSGIDQIKRKFELKEAEGYSVRFIRLGEATIRQYFVDGFVTALLKGRIDRGEFFGSVEINTTIFPKSTPKTEEAAPDWKDEPNLAIKIKVR